MAKKIFILKDKGAGLIEDITADDLLLIEDTTEVDTTKTMLISLSPQDTDLELGVVKGFIITKDMELVSAQLTAYPVPEGDDIEVAITINDAELQTLQILDGISVGELVTPELLIEVGDRVDFKILQIGTIETGQNLNIELTLKNL